jgi:hypothetical protein
VFYQQTNVLHVSEEHFGPNFNHALGSRVHEVMEGILVDGRGGVQQRGILVAAGFRVEQTRNATMKVYNVMVAFNTRKNALVVADLQTSCNKVVVKPVSGCVRTACSQFVVTSLEQVVITLLQG